MAQIATTIKQSKRLIQLGLNSETADMWWSQFGNMNNCCQSQKADAKYEQIGLYFRRYSLYDDIPAWSISALLHQLPFPELWQEMIAGMIVWKCKVTYYEDDVTYTSQICNTEMDAVLDCVIWVLENKHKNYC